MKRSRDFDILIFFSRLNYCKSKNGQSFQSCILSHWNYWNYNNQLLIHSKLWLTMVIICNLCNSRVLTHSVNLKCHICRKHVHWWVTTLYISTPAFGYAQNALIFCLNSLKSHIDFMDAIWDSWKTTLPSSLEQLNRYDFNHFEVTNDEFYLPDILYWGKWSPREKGPGEIDIYS